MYQLNKGLLLPTQDRVEKIKKGCIKNKQQSSFCKRLSTAVRSHGVMYRNDIICSSSHETYTAAPVVLVETSIKKYGNGHTMLVTPKTTFELVVTPSENFKGQITSVCEYNKNNFHGCLKIG